MLGFIYFDSLKVDRYGICSVVTSLTDEGYGKIYFTEKSDIDCIVNKMNNIRLKKREKFNPQGSKSPLGYVKFCYTDNTMLNFEIYGDSIYESESKTWYELKTDIVLYEDLTVFFDVRRSQ